jgi:hypothetical protein
VFDLVVRPRPTVRARISRGQPPVDAGLLNVVRASREAGLTLTEIAENCNSSGLKTRGGKTFTHKAIARMLEAARRLDLVDGWPAVRCLCGRLFIRKRKGVGFVALNVNGAPHKCAKGGLHEFMASSRKG